MQLWTTFIAGNSFKPITEYWKVGPMDTIQKNSSFQRNSHPACSTPVIVSRQPRDPPMHGSTLVEWSADKKLKATF